MLLTLIIIAAACGLFILVLSLSGKDKAGWLQFYARGKDSGFSFREIELLRQLAVKCSLDDPSALFWSQNQLDACIRFLVRSMNQSGWGADQANQDFLSRLYDYRKKIEMEKPRTKSGLSNSRQIAEGQSLRVLVKGTGVFKSQVVKNTATHLAISRPVNTKQTGTFSWEGLEISVYFWRQDDAGYVFDTQVQDEVFSKGLSSLKIAHSESLFRTQKRKSVRLKLYKPAFLYLLTSDEEMDKLEAAPGLKCFLQDLSDTGCAITIGGQAREGLRIKVQFALNDSPIVMCGTVRSIEYKEDTDRSLLHVEADPLPIEIRNKILGEVFGTLPDEEDELPFRVLAEEAEEVIAGQVPENNEEFLDIEKDDAASMKTAV